jgi:hypothetical protein
MLRKLTLANKNKSSLFLLILALIMSGIGAQAAGVLNSPSGGYLVCVNSKTKVISHPGATKCPNGSKKLVLGAQGQAGISGLTGAAGISGKDGINGKDGKTLWNGLKDPETTWGAPGDIFINATTKTLFGPKNLDGSWPAGVSMVGPAGATGPIGLTGATGPQGPGGNGPAGATGPTGAAGLSGVEIIQLAICGAGGTSLCKIGSIGPGGGLIFMVDYNDRYEGFNYLEAAPISCEASRRWSSANTSVTAVKGWAARTVGVGSTNTAEIKTAFSSDTPLNNAAHFATSCRSGSKSDWFLGSLSEMKLMNDNLQGLGGFTADYYWSSTELQAEYAWATDFKNGELIYPGKPSTYYVRPVRAF